MMPSICDLTNDKELCFTTGPEAYQSEDIRLLRDEWELGERYLGQVAALRDECQELQWKRSLNAKFSRYAVPNNHHCVLTH